MEKESLLAFQKLRFVEILILILICFLANHFSSLFLKVLSTNLVSIVYFRPSRSPSRHQPRLSAFLNIPWEKSTKCRCPSIAAISRIFSISFCTVLKFENRYWIFSAWKIRDEVEITRTRNIFRDSRSRSRTEKTRILLKATKRNTVLLYIQYNKSWWQCKHKHT